MTKAVLAAVHTGDQAVALRTFARPTVPPDGGLLRVQSAGMCGADIGAFQRGTARDCILGHENVGVIEEVGDVAAARWGVRPGDRVVLEEYLPCWHCDWCRLGEYRLCYATDKGQNPDALRFGNMPVSFDPALWGGYSQFLFLPSRSVLHRIGDEVPDNHASLTLPIANGFQWTVFDGGVGPGSSVLILGPGPQGLACVVAAVEAGAHTILLSGLEADKSRLEAGARLGAQQVLQADRADFRQQVLDATDGRGPDVIVDATSASVTEPLYTAFELVKRKGGTVVMQGLNTPVAQDFPLGLVASKYITLRIARGHSSRAVALAIRTIASKRHDLSLVATHTVGLHELSQAFTMARSDQSVIHITVDPWR